MIIWEIYDRALATIGVAVAIWVAVREKRKDEDK